MQIAAEAELDNRQFWLAVIYDELVREKWHDLAYSNRRTFDVNVAATTIDEKVLASAQKEFDAARKPQPSVKGGGKQSSHETKGACFNCGEVGHIARDCPTGDGGKAAGGKGQKRQTFSNHHGGGKRHRK